MIALFVLLTVKKCIVSIKEAEVIASFYKTNVSDIIRYNKKYFLRKICIVFFYNST